MKSQQPDNQVNILIAIVLSMAVLLGWSYFIAGPQLEADKIRFKSRRRQRKRFAVSLRRCRRETGFA